MKKPRQERPEIVSRERFFHWDNPSVHTTAIVQAWIATNDAQVLEHPLYLPDLAPVDYYCFGGWRRSWLVSSWLRRATRIPGKGSWEPFTLTSSPLTSGGGLIGATVSELIGWVRNVVLINVYLDLENPGDRDFGWEGIWARWENGDVSLRATWERGGRILSQQGGFQVSEGGRTGEQRGAKGICHVHNSCLVVYIVECLEWLKDTSCIYV